ncbi:hypothetical protein ABB37_00588 [Leptomonas pyrrhocoris]|uniref:Uncharacterized protein n=1 Tax=Leptomonas pyrrhocoris TaxID=157538 RepID=A0A0N0E0G4_LEPPY|nr:hypothetical protein ABB37_00588 [Leptomonas pyrrhocoris]KPA86412.1 hypothetical protein ABB37_00588 [Leptomonas pyrrhocoris]|eukprot:XP_015664851.1 hypothetical protein ABB37_00588 [Leptomonas pyrrhocoris]
MARYLDVKQDDELFAARLQEVNREMDTLLHKTSRTRHEMDRTAEEVRMGVPLHFYPMAGVNTVGSSAQRFNLLHQTASIDDGGVISNALQNDLTRGVVSAELTQWMRTHLPTLVAPLVDVQVQRHLQQLRTTVEDVQSRQAQVEQSFKETAEQLRAHRRDMQSGLAAMQRSVQHDLDEHQHTLESRLNTWKEEMQRVKDDIRTLQEQRRGETGRVDRRMDESLQRGQQLMQDTFANLERDLQRWRQSLQRDVEQDTQVVRTQHDSLEGHVAQLQGALSSTANMATRCSTEIQRLMEASVARSSEVRLCRRDVNRLEMLMQCTALQTATGLKVPAAGAAGAESGERDNATSKNSLSEEGGDGSAPAHQAVVALTQEVAHINDKVQAVVDRMDGLDRQVRQLDVALVRGIAVAMPRSSFIDIGQDTAEESLFGRSVASTRHPSNSQLSSVHTSRSGFSNVRHIPSQTSAVYQDNITNRNVVNDLHGRSEGNSPSFVHSATQPVGITSRPSHFAASANTGNFSLRHVENGPARAGAEPSGVYRPPTSHLSNSSLPFEDDADDPHPMPIVVSDGRPAPGVVSSRVVTSRSFVGGREGSSPPQRRAPPRVIPVETVAPSPVREKAAAGAIESTPTGSPGKPTPNVGGNSGAHNSSKQRRSSSSSQSARSDENGERSGHGNDDKRLDKSPFSFSLDRYGGAYAAGGGDGRVAPTNPTEPPATAADAAASPADSYVSDTPAAAEESPVASRDLLDRYTPAPASDSEGERDNEVISRSALD